MSRNIKPEVRNFIKWAQKGHCLLCPYPFRLHLHHVISVDDGGPNHYFNLVALCPNHHYLVETIKREIAPKTKDRDYGWMRKGLKAINFRDKLDKTAKEILDVLSKPHKFSNVQITNEGIDIIEYLAHEIKNEDAKLLNEINRTRPRIFLCPPWQSTLKKNVKNTLYGLDQFDKKELQRKIDEQAKQKLEQVGYEIYIEVITKHLKNISIPFVAFPSEIKE